MHTSALKSLLGSLVAGSLLVGCGPREASDSLAGQAAELQNAEGFYVAASESTRLGTITSGTFADTQVADGVAQVLSETPPYYDSTHKKLDHTWTLPTVPAGHYTLRVIARKSLADFETFSFGWKHATDEYLHYDACQFTGTSYVTCEAHVAATGGDILVNVSENWHLESNATSLFVDFIGLTVRADYTAPTVSITSPVSGSTVSGLVNIDVDATDDVGVTRVDFYRKGALIGSDTTPPFSLAWDTTAEPNDSSVLSAKAFDATGNVATSANVYLNVLNAGGVDTQAPTGALTSPQVDEETDLSGIVTVAVSAQDNIGVARVEFYSDYSVLIGSDTTAPYSVDWDTTPLSNGIHNLRVRIYDAAGNSTTLDSSFWIYNAKADEATLSVTATGRLGPVITSNPAGIYAHANMPGSATFILGTQITLKVDSSRTAIWSGACSSSGAKRSSCTFTFTGNSSVSANIQ